MAIHIRTAEAISTQSTYKADEWPLLTAGQEAAYYSCQHPSYRELIPAPTLRRISPVIRMGMAASLSCVEQAGIDTPGAILIGSGLGCVKDTVKFLNQVHEQEENLLNPTAFIQSTHNTVSGQIALVLSCKEHNLTFTQKNISFESALLEGRMMLEEDPALDILLGGLDEITPESHALLVEAGCAKDGPMDASLESISPGAVAGEGVAFFILSGEAGISDLARIDDMALEFGIRSSSVLRDRILAFLKRNGLGPGDVDLVLSGRSGDARSREFYIAAEGLFPGSGLAAYKHLFGEYDTASAMGLYLGANILHKDQIPEAMEFRAPLDSGLSRVLLLNLSKGAASSFLLLSKSP
jgi:3-oxoacyl-(acyl-carrier-protein) synthase